MKCPLCGAENDASASHCQACGEILESPTELFVAVDLSPDTQIGSRYEILRPLGCGGMGMVFKAHDRALDETVAIKVLRPEYADTPKMAERFKAEIKLARRIRHKNVCAIHDFGEYRGLRYISMEFVDGPDLKRWIRERGPLPAEQACDVAVQVAEALQAVHEAGIVHRDLKTANIMIGSDGVARLMDFGVAKRGDVSAFTSAGQIIGTPEYMSPEQAQGLPVDFRTDIYALGIVIFELFTGRVPFRGDTPVATILKQMHEPPPVGPKSRVPIPEPMRRVLMRALAKDSEKRYQTAAHLAEAIREARDPWRKQAAAPTEVLEAPTRPAPRAARWRRPAAHAAAGVALVVLLAAAWWLLKGRPTTPTSATSSVETTSTASEAAPAGSGAAPTSSTTPSTTTVEADASTTSIASTTSSVPTTTTSARLTTSVPPPASRPAAPGMLQIAVIPWGEVWVDEKLVGTTPMEAFELEPGAHSVQVRHPRFEVWEEEIVVRAGQSQKLVIDLNREGQRKP